MAIPSRRKHLRLDAGARVAGTRRARSSEVQARRSRRIHSLCIRITKNKFVGLVLGHRRSIFLGRGYSSEIDFIQRISARGNTPSDRAILEVWHPYLHHWRSGGVKFVESQMGRTSHGRSPILFSTKVATGILFKFRLGIFAAVTIRRTIRQIDTS